MTCLFRSTTYSTSRRGHRSKVIEIIRSALQSQSVLTTQVLHLCHDGGHVFQDWSFSTPFLLCNTSCRCPWPSTDTQLSLAWCCNGWLTFRDLTRNRSWHISRFYHGICLGRLRKTTSAVSHGSRCPGWDSNQAPLEYTSSLQPSCWVQMVDINTRITDVKQDKISVAEVLQTGWGSRILWWMQTQSERALGA
jgi:hypothetical protein